MENEKLERVLRTVNPARRLFLKRFLFGATFAVPIVASYSVKDVAYAGTTTVTEGCTEFVTTTTFSTVTVTVTESDNN